MVKVKLELPKMADDGFLFSMSEYCHYLLSKRVPDLERVEVVTRSLLRWLFPLREEATDTFGDCVGDCEKLGLTLCTVIEGGEKIAEEFIACLPVIREELLQDARLIFEDDPAATCLEEVILSYPGFRATAVYRLAHELHKKNVPMIPRMMSEWIHSQTGIDIHPGAQIASPFFIDHGTGVVIGETAIVGKGVRIYQGVTLGSLAVKKEEARKKRHPTVGDNVIIYAGSTILGGKTEIGHDSVIGGNSWLTKSILPHSIVYTKHETIVRDKPDFKQPIDFNI